MCGCMCLWLCLSVCLSVSQTVKLRQATLTRTLTCVCRTCALGKVGEQLPLNACSQLWLGWTCLAESCTNQSIYTGVKVSLRSLHEHKDLGV